MTVDDTGSLALEGHVEEVAHDGTLAVDGLADGVDDTTDETLADREGSDAACALDDVALIDGADFAEHDDADVVLL